MSRVSVRTKIKEKLDAFTGSGQPLAFVYESHEAKLEGYPCATFDMSENEEDFATTAENMERLMFEVYVHVLVGSGSGALTDATKAVDTLLDAITNAFRDDYNLGGVAHYCKPMSGNYGEYQETAGLVKYGRMKLECFTLVN